MVAGTQAPAQDALKSGFEAPPVGARPRVWWHWMNGNITMDGIKLDLEWMHRIGLAGYQKFDMADVKPYKANSPLLASGLKGPVRLMAEK